MPSNQLTVIGRAHEYVTEYVNNGYRQAEAYSKVFKCSYQNAIANANRYAITEQVKEAFQCLIGSSIREYFKSRDGIILEAQGLYSKAMLESTDSALKCLKFIAELAGHINKSDKPQGNTINIDLRSIVVNQSQAKSLVRKTLGKSTINYKPDPTTPGGGH